MIGASRTWQAANRRVAFVLVASPAGAVCLIVGAAIILATALPVVLLLLPWSAPRGQPGR